MTPRQNTASDGAITASRFPIRLLTIALFLTTMTFAWFGWIIFDLSREAKVFRDQSLRTEELRGVIVHLDEVLTMSARMAAATGDPKWEERYRHFDPQLDAAIKETVRLGTSPSSVKTAAKTDEANIKLVAMENRAFALVRAGRKEEALAVLFSPEYEAQKQIYADGINSFNSQIRREADNRERQDKWIDVLSMIGALVVLAISFVAWFSVLRSLQRWRADLEQAVSRRQQAEQSLRQANETLEARIQQRTAELEKTNQTLQVEITERKQTELEIQRQATFPRFNPNPVLELSATGEITFFNHAAGAIAREMERETPAQMLPPNTAAMVRECLASGTPKVRVETQIGARVISWSFFPVKFNNTVHCYAGDITERRQSEEALRRSETKFRTLYDSTGDAVMLLDEKGFFDCNPAALAMLGCASREEFCSKHPADVSPPMQPDGTDSLTLANLQIATALEKGSHHFEWMHKRADTGEAFPADVLLSVMELDGKRVLQAVVRDITERKRSEKSMRLQSAALEAAANAIVITDQDGTIQSVNPAFTTLTGYTAQEAVGQNPRILKSGKQDKAFYRNLWQTISSGQIWSGELTNRRKDGSIYTEEMTITPLRNTDGVIARYIAIKQDITVRKRAEAGLKLFRALIDHSSDGIYVMDPATRRFLDVNESGCRALGYTRDELLALTALDVSAEGDRASLDAADIQMEKVGRAVAETLHRRKDGTTYPVEASLSHVTLDREYLVAIVRDITERKRAEETLRASQQITEGIINAIPARVFWKDKNLVYLGCNTVFARDAGFADPKDIIGKDDYQMGWRAQAEKYRGDDRQVIESGCSKLLIEEPQTAPEGNTITLLSSKIPLRSSDGQISGVLGTYLDITARKQTEVALQERVRLAVLDAEVGTALTRGGTLAEMLRLCGEAIVRQLDGAFARIWTLNERDQMLELQASAGLYTHLNGPHGRVPVGQFKIGLIAQERKPHLTNQVVGDPRVGDQEWAKREGMAAFAGYPLLVEDRLVGVVAMFSRHILNETTLKALASVSNNIAVGIERKRAEEALRSSKKKLQDLFESSRDAMMTSEPPSWKFTSGNPAAVKMFGAKSEEDFISHSPWELSPDRQPDGRASAEKAREMVEKAYREGSHFFEWTHRRIGGEEFPATVLISRMQSAEKVFHQATVRDITESKRAQAELENLQKQLVEASRRGGMAEIATNVLHNVGNILNSVNISTDLIIDSVKKSKASSLARVVVLLQEHAHDLGAFLTHDPSGQHVPAHLARLSEHLTAEQGKIAGELDSLRRNVDHIKEIVAMQQSYATVGGVKETIDVTSLVEDSMRLNEDALRRHGVEVVRELEKVPPMSVEKHKILQILVNLVRNAKYACDDSGRADRRLTVRVANGDGRVKISIIDNGIGIPPENLTRIFNYGFTTRKGGHGFGLHSSALAAKEMGGSLTARSGGPGQGADFTLELPCPTRGEPT